MPLDLNSLAAGALGETQQRVAGGSAQNSGALRSMLNQTRAGFTSKEEGDTREQTFTRAQAILSEALAQREEAMRIAQEEARMRFEDEQNNLQRQFVAGQGAQDRASEMTLAQMRRAAEVRDAQSGGDGEPDWFTKQDYAFQQDIERARILDQMEDQDQARDERRATKAEQAASRFSTKDFGSHIIDPRRGQAVLQSRNGRPQKGGWLSNILNPAYTTPTGMKDVSRILAENPDNYQAALRERFGNNPVGTARASVYLYNLLSPPG